MDNKETIEVLKRYQDDLFKLVDSPKGASKKDRFTQKELTIVNFAFNFTESIFGFKKVEILKEGRKRESFVSRTLVVQILIDLFPNAKQELIAKSVNRNRTNFFNMIKKHDQIIRFTSNDPLDLKYKKAYFLFQDFVFNR